MKEFDFITKGNEPEPGIAYQLCFLSTLQKQQSDCIWFIKELEQRKTIPVEKALKEVRDLYNVRQDVLRHCVE